MAGAALASVQVVGLLLVLFCWSGTAAAAATSTLFGKHDKDYTTQKEISRIATRKLLQVLPSPAADAEKNPERLIPSGPSDPRQYQNTISDACRRALDLIAAPPMEPQREVPTGPEDPHMYQRLKDFLACWKAMRPPHNALVGGSGSSTAELMNIQPQRQVPTGPDPIHHKSLPQSTALKP